MLTYDFRDIGKDHLYEYLYRKIREEILSGRLGPGERIPSRREFARNNGISTITVENAYAQPSSKIISIGNNKFLMVFLDDTASRDTMQAATLTWTVYDASSDTWTTPQVVQNDSTADGRPHLADAGDKVILTWASIAEDKYEEVLHANHDICMKPACF